MATRVTVPAALLTLLAICFGLNKAEVSAKTIQLSAILPKLQAIHEDSKTLLIKNAELRAKITAGLQVQKDSAKLAAATQLPELVLNSTELTSGAEPLKLAPKWPNAGGKSIDYAELDEFNKWVEVHLNYAVKNTHASIDAFTDDAQQNNGNVEYSEQAIKDGIEGIKYWQSAVTFQDKTLKNEKFDVD